MTITIMPYDLTASKLTNRVNGEKHTLTQVAKTRPRICVPVFGAYYAKYLGVFDEATGRKLIPEVDYETVVLYKGLTKLTSLAVNAAIKITNPEVSNNIRLDYRAVGGPYAISIDELRALLESIDFDKQTFTWEKVVNKPNDYLAEEHTHEWWQLYSMETPVDTLKRMSESIGVGDSGVIEDNRRIAVNIIEQLKTEVAVIENTLNIHVGDKNNPHIDSRRSVGLGDLINAAVATKAQAMDANNSVNYMTPGLGAYVMEQLATPFLIQHVLNRDNPHGTRAEDIGGVSIAYANDRYSKLLHVTHTAYGTTLWSGNTYNQVMTSIRTNLSASDFSTGVFSTNQLGAGGNANSADYFLLGNNTWISKADFINRVKSSFASVGAVNFIGGYASAAQFMSVIETTYNNIVYYPNGTTMIGRVTQQGAAWYTNGSLRYLDFHRNVIAKRINGVWSLIVGEETLVQH